MKTIMILSLFLAFTSAQAASTSTKTQQASQTKKSTLAQDLDSLGDDRAVVERAKALSPNNKVDIVQKRAVDRNLRLELGVDYGIIGGGDSYLNSQNFGGHMDFHITPRWSIGARYESFINTLTPEGQAVYSAAKLQYLNGNPGQTQVSPIDSPIQTGLVVVDWYPVYGKMNVFSWIPHFDIYTLVGFGKTETENNGWSNTYAGGLGIGLWLNQLVALRLEGRYQTYQDKPIYSDTRQQNLFIGQASLGILL